MDKTHACKPLKHRLYLDSSLIIYRLSMLYFLFFSFGKITDFKSYGFSIFLFLGVVLWSLVGLLLPKDKLKTWYWGCMASLNTGVVLYNWETIDNHVYLLTYWSLVLGLTCYLNEDKKVQALAINAKLLVGLCMFFAILQKTISQSYFSGLFFFHELYGSPRFMDGVYYFHVLWTQFIQLVQPIITSFPTHIDGAKVLLDHWVPLKNLSLEHKGLLFSLTWFTYIIESLLFILFLAPDRSWNIRNRHICLMVFSISVYSIVNVFGFSLLLNILGFSSTKEPLLKKIYMLIMMYLIILKFFNLDQLVLYFKMLLS